MSPRPRPTGRVLTVSDDGIGIAAADLPRFSNLSQLDSGLSRRYEGSGLGLVIVSRLVELHNGSIRVTSDGVPGKGASSSLRCRGRRHHLLQRAST